MCEWIHIFFIVNKNKDNFKCKYVDWLYTKRSKPVGVTSSQERSRGIS